MVHVVLCPVCSDPVTEKPPRRWRNSCPDCAADVAASHKASTGHRVEQYTTEPVSPAQRLADARTVRVAGKAGW